jgi:hypothetical protein
MTNVVSPLGESFAGCMKSILFLVPVTMIRSIRCSRRSTRVRVPSCTPQNPALWLPTRRRKEGVGSTVVSLKCRSSALWSSDTSILARFRVFAIGFLDQLQPCSPNQVFNDPIYCQDTAGSCVPLKTSGGKGVLPNHMTSRSLRPNNSTVCSSCT